MRWAITPAGVGQPVGFRTLRENDSALAEGETFITTTDPDGRVLADDGASLRAPRAAETLARAKTAKLAQLREIREQQLDQGVTFDDARYWTDRQSVLDVAQAVIGFLMLGALSPSEIGQLPSPPPSSVRWKTRDGYRNLNPRQVFALFAAISTHIQATFAKEETAVGQVTAATTFAQIEAVSWPK